MQTETSGKNSQRGPHTEYKNDNGQWLEKDQK